LIHRSPNGLPSGVRDAEVSEDHSPDPSDVSDSLIVADMQLIARNGYLENLTADLNLLSAQLNIGRRRCRS
jgi:hypothetical protein